MINDGRRRPKERNSWRTNYQKQAFFAYIQSSVILAIRTQIRPNHRFPRLSPSENRRGGMEYEADAIHLA
jgi:hypothetical protein